MTSPRDRSTRTSVFLVTAVILLALARAHGDAPRAMQPVDILDWKTIGPTALSADGKWLAYRYNPVQGDGSVIVRATDSDTEYRFPMGEIPPSVPTATPQQQGPPNVSSSIAFSEDAKWVAFTTYPTRRQAEALRKQRKPVQTSVQLVSLATGAKTEYPKVRRFVFSGGETSLALALHRFGADAPSGGAAPAASSNRPKGSDLIVRDLASGNELTIGGVSEFSFDKPGRWLAWTIDVEEKIGNGVSLRDLKTGTVTPLDSGKAVYERPTWNEEGTAFAVLKGVEDKAYQDKLYAVVGTTNLADATRKVIFDPAKETTFPSGMTISANRAPEWTDDRAGLLFGIVPAKKKDSGDSASDDDASKSDASTSKPDTSKPEDTNASASSAPASSDKVDLVLWHWKDGRLQSQQQTQEERDKRFSYLATYRVADKKFLRLADDELRDVTAPDKGTWAVGIDRRAYELTEALEGRRYSDVYTVDLTTGARKLAVKQMRWYSSQSPDGTKLLYYEGGHYHVFDTATGQTTNITRGVPASFVDVEDDHNVIAPPIQPEGWSADSRSVVLSDSYDIWQVPVVGGAAVNLTGNGRRDRIRYDRVSIDPEEKGIDLAAPQYFTMLGEWSKKGGIARVSASKLDVLVWDDAGYGRPLKAKRAPVVAYTRETAKEFPDYYVADEALKGAHRVTDGQAQVGDYAWSSGGRLVEFTTDAPVPRKGESRGDWSGANRGATNGAATNGSATNGGAKAAPSAPSAITLNASVPGNTKRQKMQAALYLPANYEPGKKYPTIVYIYERLSDSFNRFAQPTANGFNKSVYTSNGYAVLTPDITYTVNDPGMSAVWCVLPALQAAIATGVVDPARVGLHGHSWGGYQTSFLVTQTNAFKAAIAGAPLTNMVSMYSLVYKNTGGGNMAIFESSQGRFRGGYWDNWDAYVRNSPIAHAAKVNTPLVILHNDKDGAVDFTQGVEYYNTLRRLKKPVVLLEYVGENHGLVKPANRFDYTVRMREFFDHHLKGAPAPDWWTNGVPRLDMDTHLKSRQPKPKKPAATPAPTTLNP